MQTNKLDAMEARFRSLEDQLRFPIKINGGHFLRNIPILGKL